VTAVNGELRSAGAIVLAPIHALAWVGATFALGALALWHFMGLVLRLRRVFAQTLTCSRRHRTAAYGVFECRCGALVEGWAFDRCRVCGQSAGWMPCSRCGLPIRNPILE